MLRPASLLPSDRRERLEEEVEPDSHPQRGAGHQEPRRGVQLAVREPPDGSPESNRAYQLPARVEVRRRTPVGVGDLLAASLAGLLSWQSCARRKNGSAE